MEEEGRLPRGDWGRGRGVPACGAARRRRGGGGWTGQPEGPGGPGGPNSRVGADRPADAAEAGARRGPIRLSVGSESGGGLPGPGRKLFLKGRRERDAVVSV